MKSSLLTFLILILGSSSAFGLEPKQIFIVVNKQVAASKEIAEYYCEKRQVPKENMIPLDLPTEEDISRSDYESKLLLPLRKALKEKKDQVQCLLTIYGVPLRVGIQPLSKEEKEEVKKLQPERAKLRADRDLHRKDVARLERLVKLEGTQELRDQLDEAKKKLNEVSNKLRPVEAQIRALSHAETRASVDSELSLLWREKYSLDRWQYNELYWRSRGRVDPKSSPMIMVARLDGSSPKLVKRLIDDGIATEKTGLDGKVYVDARGIKHRPGSSEHGYSGYDESLRMMAASLKVKTKMPVTLDDKSALFAVGSCKECALYCGWYSHANFIDCCQFVRGAVAFHIASSEAVSLKRPGAKYWCKNLLEKGAAVTLGPVAEPYTVGFPKPHEFFDLLVSGKHTVVECYWRSQLLTSWMMVLIGDPLYRPFQATKK